MSTSVLCTLVLFRPFCPLSSYLVHSVHFGLIQSILSNLVLLGLLCPLWLTSVLFGPFGILWFYSVHFFHFGPIQLYWSCLVHFGLIWSYSVHFSTLVLVLICPFLFHISPIQSTLFLFGPLMQMSNLICD